MSLMQVVELLPVEPKQATDAWERCPPSSSHLFLRTASSAPALETAIVLNVHGNRGVGCRVVDDDAVNAVL